MDITRELRQLEAQRSSMIAELRAEFGQRGFDVGPYSDDMVSSAMRRSRGAWGRPILIHAFGLLTQAS